VPTVILSSKRLFAPILLLLLLIPGVATLWGKDKLRLIQADQLEQVTRNEISFKKLTGKVIFQKGELTLKCDLVYWYEKDDRAEFYNHIIATKKTQTLTCERLTFFNETDLLVARDNPVLTDQKTRITAKSIRFYTKDEISEAEGNVYLNDDKRNLQAKFVTYSSPEKKTIALQNAVLNDLKRHTSLTADSLVYFNESGNMEAMLSPEMIRRDSTGKETFRIKGDLIKSDEDAGNFLSMGHVVIKQEDFIATCERVEYNDSTEFATLIGKPRVVSNDQVIAGQRMDLRFKDEKLYSLFIDQNAVATSDSFAYLPSTDTSRAVGDSVVTHDEIAGKFMEIYFEDGKADSVRVFGMATSYYNVLEDSIIQGVNEASGDTVIINFSKGKIQTLTVIGGTEGRFIPDHSNRDVDTTIVYSADRIDYFMKNKTTELTGKSKIQSADVELTAGKILIRWDDNLLYADPLNPTLSDSLDDDVPTLLQRGREPFSGEKMVYNMKTQKGKIVEGKTKEQDGYYYGDNVTKIGKNVFYVTNGIYTTCSLDPPHYYFKSKKMKLIQKDKIIAKPIVLYIHDIPIIGLPFGIFPNKGGRRHSGWIMPTYGDNKNVGQFIKGLGYFWTFGDYADLRLTGNFYDKKGVILNYRTRYVVRYKFDGSIDGSYTDDFFSDYPKRRWELNVNHNQPISQTMRFTANGRFVSDDDYKRTIKTDLDDRLDQQLISNATLSKSWSGTPYSMSINFTQTNNLQAKTLILVKPTAANQRISYIDRSLPNISLTRTSKQIFPLKAGRDASQSKWYNNIYFNVSSRLRDTESIYYLSNDSLAWEQTDVKKSAVASDVALNGSQKLFKYFSTSENLSFTEGWLFDYEQPALDSTGGYTIVKNVIQSEKVKGFKARHTGSFSLNGQTKLYGMFPIRVGSLEAVRHVMTPSVGFSYRPDFTQEIFGWNPNYIQTWTDSTGKVWTFDPFRNSLLGGISSGEQRSATFSLSNVFQAKTRKEGKENKIDLFSFSSSTNYNFAADSLRWAPISTSFRTQLSKALIINFSAMHDFYAYQNSRRVNNWNKVVHGVPIPRLTSVSATTGFSLSGRRFGKIGAPSDQETADTLASDILSPDLGNKDMGEESGGNANDGGELWSASLSFRYSLSRMNPVNKTESFWTTLKVKLNLTRKWSIEYTASIDALNKNIVGQNISVQRDLHCWQMSFSWVPTGYGKQFTLLINVKSPTLRDLKYEERGGRQSRYGI